MEKILFPRIHMQNIAFIGEIYFGALLGAKVLRENFVVFEHLFELLNLVREIKTEYHCQLAAKLVNPSTSAKTYRSILKTYANGRKVPVILPLLINSEFISNFKTKANYFNRFFSPSSFNLATNETVTTINFDEQLNSKLIVALNPNKAYGHDGLSIRMLQMGSDFISKPLSITFRNFLKAGCFPAAWEKANVVLVHKKETNKF